MSDYGAIVTKRSAQVGVNNGMPGSTAVCLQVDEEMVWLAPRIEALRPETVLEIGIYKAGWPYVLAPFFAPGAQIIGIDAMLRHQWEDGTAGIDDLDRTVAALKGAGFVVDILSGRSDKEGMRPLVEELLDGEKLDLLHIDGAHHYKGVLFDWLLYGPMVRRGGLVVFHDIGTLTSQMQVKRLWEDIVAEYPDQTEEIYVKNGIGVVEM